MKMSTIQRMLTMTPCIETEPAQKFHRNVKQTLPLGSICYAVWRMAWLEC